LTNFGTDGQKEYLLELRESHHNTSQNSLSQEISVGEMVLVHQDNQRRGSWKLGKVEKLIKGDDHKVRSAIVKVNGEGKKANQLKRPIKNYIHWK
jgi:hypothetical protein